MRTPERWIARAVQNWGGPQSTPEDNKLTTRQRVSSGFDSRRLYHHNTLHLPMRRDLPLIFAI